MKVGDLVKIVTASVITRHVWRPDEPLGKIGVVVVDNIIIGDTLEPIAKVLVDGQEHWIYLDELEIISESVNDNSNNNTRKGK
jgi:hypothetical protein|tara:strand:+ start:7114 stop:7362 length:249 start_codon:yes stop_codon:yes gene_type:complete